MKTSFKFFYLYYITANFKIAEIVSAFKQPCRRHKKYAARSKRKRLRIAYLSRFLELVMGLEPATCALRMRCSTN